MQLGPAEQPLTRCVRSGLLLFRRQAAIVLVTLAMVEPMATVEASPGGSTWHMQIRDYTYNYIQYINCINKYITI